MPILGAALVFVAEFIEKLHDTFNDAFNEVFTPDRLDTDVVLRSKSIAIELTSFGIAGRSVTGLRFTTNETRSYCIEYPRFLL